MGTRSDNPGIKHGLYRWHCCECRVAGTAGTIERNVRGSPMGSRGVLAFSRSPNSVGGALGDLFGRRRIFAIGVVVFTLSSIWCGFSPNILQLIIARSVQGIGGALLVPGSLAIISASFSDDQRGRAIGTWSGFTSITTVIGPVIGGWLVQYASWRYVFFINVPLAVIVLCVLFWRVPESRDKSMQRKLDWSGTISQSLD